MLESVVDTSEINALEHGKELVKSGDLVVETYRQYFIAHYHRDSRLTDDQIIVLVMESDKDYDSATWATLMWTAESAR